MPGSTPYVLVEERSVGGKQTKGRRIFQLVLCIVSIVLAALLFIHGILSLIASHTNPFTKTLNYTDADGVKYNRDISIFSIRVLSAYMLILSILFICFELKSTTVLTPFAGMVSPLGRGVIYLLTGFLVFGTVGNWGLFYGVIWMCCGVAHIVLSIMSGNCRQFYDDGTIDNGSATVSRKPVSSSYEASTAGGEKNFCRSCGAALRPSDSFCPDCSAAV